MTQGRGKLYRLIVYISIFIGPYSSLYAGKVTYFYTDPQGSVLAYADAQGNVASMLDYRPYGDKAMTLSPDGPGYTGHVNDADSGLIYMQARYYDSIVSRFLSSDPKKLSPGDVYNFDRFSYGNSNPIRNIDPDGRNAIITHNSDGSINIQVPIKFSGPAANQQNIDAIKSDVASRWSGLYVVGGEITKVSVAVVDVNESTPKSAINNITLTNGPTTYGPAKGVSYVQDHQHGEWNMASSGMKVGEAAHETGHLMDEADHYVSSTNASGERVTTAQPGYENNLMGALKAGVMTDSRNLDVIMNSSANIQQWPSETTDP